MKNSAAIGNGARQAGPCQPETTVPGHGIAEAKADARAAGLRYVSDTAPGITRRRSGKGFSYRHPDGSPVRDSATLQRIRQLAIPPAYTEVWICPLANGHIQATGRDARGRKQYRYHARWQEVRDGTKYGRLAEFGQALPLIREKCAADLALPGLPRRKVLAALVQLLERTAIRVGNEDYVKQNKSFGLTTLRNHHARIEGNAVRFHFRGKSGKWHDIELKDRRLVRILKRLQELPGQELFQYLDEEGNIASVDSADVNAYLKEITCRDFTAKDFRTWAGTVMATRLLMECASREEKGVSKAALLETIKCVARHLGNTPAICRKSYIHPAVIECFTTGVLRENLPMGTDRPGTNGSATPGTSPSAAEEEAAILQLLSAAELHAGRAGAPTPAQDPNSTAG